MLLKWKAFVPSLQTADGSSDSPACLAVSCFKAAWPLGLCGEAAMQTGVTVRAGLSIRSCYAGIVLFLICLWPAKGLTASVSLTPLRALRASHYSFREENIAIRLLSPWRARARLPTLP